MSRRAPRAGKGVPAPEARRPSPPDGRSFPSGTGGPARQRSRKEAPAVAPDELRPLNPVFAWFEGGDVLQFGELCAGCTGKVREECRDWSRETLGGLRSNEPKVLRECPCFVKWDKEEITRDKLKKDELAEGEKNPGECPDCATKRLARAVRTSSEYGTRMNPRAVFLEWCGCGRFRAEKRELAGDREHCVFCGGGVAGAETTLFRGAMFHLDCFLRLRFFFTMSEMLKVAEGYMSTGRTLGDEESSRALSKTLEMARAFRLTGNCNVLGVNRVIHWLEGESPLVSRRTVLRTEEELLSHLEATFIGDAERSVGVQALEDGYIVYDNAAEVRWITHGSYQPVKGPAEFLRTYLGRAREGKWSELEDRRLREIPDGKCALCGAMTRSHRIATGEDGKNVYVCHHCWIGRGPGTNGSACP